MRRGGPLHPRWSYRGDSICDHGLMARQLPQFTETAAKRLACGLTAVWLLLALLGNLQSIAIRDDGRDAAMGFCGLGDLELAEDGCGVLLD